MVRLVLVLGDQLTPDMAALRAADRAHDRVVMAEVTAEATHVRHHPRKIALILAAMRKFAARLRAAGWQVDYTRLDDPDNAGSIPGELMRRAAQHGAETVLATRPGDWRLFAAIDDLPLALDWHEDDRFIATPDEFDAWARGRRELRMEWFYRLMRRKTGILMQGDQPEGGRWNYDSENRKPPRADLFAPRPPDFPPDPVVEEVLDLVETRFGDHFGRLRPFGLPTDADQARVLLDHFMAHALAHFGDFQDAMLADNPVMYHSLLSPCLNLGLLDPLEVCRRAESEWRAGRVALNAAEGFIRQILGWREYVRGIWWREGPDYVTRNALGHDRDLPPLYWGAGTRMNCMAHVVGQTRDLAYAHHIQRLMVTGNFALLAGIDPAQVHEWYLSVYVDAFEWVEAPNTIGMSQFADGGLVASKPYVSSGRYIDRMSDYCAGCHYRVDRRTGPRACPFNLLYWHFLDRHADLLSRNRRMGPVMANWARTDPATRAEILDQANALLRDLQDGRTV